MYIRQHLLHGQGVQFRPSPNRGGLFAGPYPDTIVIHYTAGASAESAIRTLSDPERSVSAHLVVARDGTVTQLVPFDQIAWHAGVSRWGQRQGLNQYSLGVEIDNAGQLQVRDGRCVSWFGQTYPAAEVVWGVHRNQTEPSPWHRYPAAQLRAVLQVCRLLVATYRIAHILGHEEIAPERKVDPGPAFPLDDLRARLLNGQFPQPDPVQARVRAVRAPVLARPAARAERVAGSVPRGTQLEVLAQQGSWCRVRLAAEGWMRARHLDDGAAGAREEAARKPAGAPASP